MESEEHEKFIYWCKRMYDDNCDERWEHGLKPYKHFEVYYFTHTRWLREQYEERQNNNGN